MFYRVTADLAFDVEDEANDFFHDCQLALLKAVTINPYQLNQERGIITLHKCHHDDPDLSTCSILSSKETPIPPFP